MKKIILGLLLLIAILITIDLLTGIWYWNRTNLVFDSTEFNNIITPVISFFAFIIYAIALYFAIYQNKVLLSQNLKPYYEKQIEEYLTKIKEIKIRDNHHPKLREYSGLDFVDAINDRLIELSQNQEYVDDFEKDKQGEKMSREYFKKRSYYNTLMFLSEYTIGINPISYFYEDLKQFIDEINLSKLIQEDKKLLKKRIKHLFVEKYFTIIDLNKKYGFMQIKIPLIYNLDNEIKFKNITETDFAKYYEWFKTELK